MLDDLMTTADVAQRVRTSPSTVRYWRHIGYGPRGFLVGRRVLYSAADVETWLTELSARAAEGMDRRHA